VFLLGNAWVGKKGGGRKRKEDAARVKETHSLHLLPSVQVHQETEILSWVGEFTGLECLCLGAGLDHGVGSESNVRITELPTALGKLLALRWLPISNFANLSDLQASLELLYNLTSLSLDELPLLIRLPGVVCALPDLLQLTLNWTELTSLPNAMRHLTQLTTLELLNLPQLTSLPEGMTTLCALKVMRVCDCGHLDVNSSTMPSGDPKTS